MKCDAKLIARLLPIRNKFVPVDSDCIFTSARTQKFKALISISGSGEENHVGNTGQEHPDIH